MTKEQRLALEVLERCGALTARAFARSRWPESFQRPSSAGPHGRGVLFGAGVSMKAGAMLRALVDDGLVRSEKRFTLDDPAPLLHYELTSRGASELEAARTRAAKYGRPGPRRRAS